MPVERIEGSTFEDSRGRLIFCNDLDLGPVVRFYRIRPEDTSHIRGWQGHQQETKWFHCLHGSLLINTVAVENFGDVDASIRPEVYTLTADKPEILKVPGGMCTALKALESGSEVLVFSDKSLKESASDDFRYPLEQWSFREK